MAMSDRRDKKAEMGRTYQGEEEARFLLSQLNKGRMIHGDSLRQIIMALQELSDCQAVSKRALLDGDPAQITQIEKVEAVNKLLRRYEALPYLRLPSPAGAAVRLGWRTRRTVSGGTQSRRNVDLEFNAVLVAVQLAGEGLIGSLKRCAGPGCEQWFFARFSHQLFHSEDCKALFYKNDPQQKAKRRKKARDYYQLQKNTNVK
jgi:hypothetical protein